MIIALEIQWAMYQGTHKTHPHGTSSPWCKAFSMFPQLQHWQLPLAMLCWLRASQAAAKRKTLISILTPQHILGGLGGFSAFTKDSAKGRETGFIMHYSLSKIARLLQNKRPLEISSICGLSEVIFNASSSCTACITNTVLQLSEL